MVEDVAEVKIRPATADDAKSIATVHIASWREAYAGIVPSEVLAGLDVDQRTEQWRRTIEDAAGADKHVWVAEGDEDGHVVGFASLGPSRDEDADRTTLEIYTIYLEPDAWGHGIARKLMRSVLESVPEGSKVTLWALAGNERAQHFYRRNGFVQDGVERLEVFGDERLTTTRWVRG